MWKLLERREQKRLDRRLAGRDQGTPPDPARPPGTDLIPQLRHIVVLMMENHSYDNYLGMLGGRGEGLRTGQDGKPDASNPARGGEQVSAHRLATTVQQPGVPSQSWRACHQQWNGGRCDGFVASAQDVMADGDSDRSWPPGTERSPMGYWTREDLPFYYGLADTFPLADHWFGSCLGPTFPNRRFLIAGTAHGLIDDSPYDLLDYPDGGTILDMLSRHGISWANYHPCGEGSSSRLGHYARHKRKMTRRRVQAVSRRWRTARTGVEKDIQFTADVFPFGIGRYMGHIRSTDEFFADAASGALPSFCIVDPDFRAYSEENPQDIRKGESFAAEVIRAVMHGRGWPNTVLIWLYDEHGGYYDHVSPPAAVPPDDVLGGSLVGRASRLGQLLQPVLPHLVERKERLNAGPHGYDRYGFRVPAVIVSPYARPGHVCPEVFDHTSVLKLVEQKWNLPPLTARDAAAVSPLSALDLDGPPAFLNPPDLPEPALRWGSW
ncbi:MAG TPA: alkaline phosphatase family protein [Streptosporangiaceae bacterium]